MPQSARHRAITDSRAIRQEVVGWREGAICALDLYPAELWFSTQKRDRELAKKICRACPVLEECTTYAVLSPVGHGVVAAMTPSQITRRKKELRHDAA
jgi:hypothetical protein